MTYSKEVLQEVENYHTIEWKKTYRAKSLYLLVIGLVVSLFHSLFTLNSLGYISNLMVLATFYIPAVIFILKGKKWAIILAQGLWIMSFSQVSMVIVFSLSDLGVDWRFLTGLIILVYYFSIKIFIRAYQVEKLRQKRGK